MATSDVEKGSVRASSPPTGTPADIAHATESSGKEEMDLDDNDAHSITPVSTGLPPTLEEKDRDEPPYPVPGQDAAIVVQRSKRRGLFGQLTLLAEVENPKTYTRRKKWFITFIVSVAGVVAPMGSSIFFRKLSRLVSVTHIPRSDMPSQLAVLSQVSKDLHATPTVTNLSISLYLLSMSIFPLWWSSFSERLGRRTIYLVSFGLFVVFNALCAISQSISMLIVMRMLGGGASASVQAVGAGTIADLWDPQERGRAMGIFFIGPLCGPLFAPIIGGALAQGWSWRVTMWFMVAYGGVTVILILFALPETLVSRKPLVSDVGAEPSEPVSRQLSRVSSRQVVQFTTRWLRMLKITFLDPLKIVLYLRYPAVLLIVYYSSITFCGLYVLNVSIATTFGTEPYNYSTLIVGLLYIPSSVGYFITSIFGGRWMDKIMQREARKANRYDENGNMIYHPEDRMRENAWLAAVLYPAALIWYGWAAQKGVYWVVPVCGHRECFEYAIF